MEGDEYGAIDARRDVLVESVGRGPGAVRDQDGGRSRFVSNEICGGRSHPVDVDDGEVSMRHRRERGHTVLGTDLEVDDVVREVGHGHQGHGVGVVVVLEDPSQAEPAESGVATAAGPQDTGTRPQVPNVGRRHPARRRDARPSVH